MYIKELDLPKIPPELARLTTNTEAFRNTPWQVLKNGVYHSSGHYQRCDVEPQLNSWIDQQVTDQYLHVSACAMYGEEHNAPHTDTTREFTLIYLTELGGDGVRTVFYREQDQEIHRPRHYHPDYHSLVTLEEYTLKPETWYLLDSRVIHSVEGIRSVRKSIQVGFGLEHDWARQHFD